jgi:hypothetical protein
MTGKPYGKFTLEQLKQFNDFVHEVMNLPIELEKLLQQTDFNKIHNIVGQNFSWIKYYELPFKEHLAWGALILNFQDELRQAAQSLDPQQTIFDLFEKKLDADDDWQGGFHGLFQMQDLLALLISVSKTIKSIMVYQKSLSTLVEEVRSGIDKSLFDAVRIDRTMIACPSILHRISFAEMTGDKKFFLHLKNALKGPSRKHMVGLDEMRYMMFALVDTGANQLNGDNLEQVFVEHLKLYPKYQSGAKKNLLKHYTATKKINHFK